MSVVVVTDSASCIDAATANESGVLVAPLHVFVGGADLREGIDPIPENFAADGPVTTAGASPDELARLYRDALARSDGAGVVAVHISKGLSSTWEAARQAAADVGDGVRVVDSASAGMGLGFAALSAARTAAAGGTLDEVYENAVSSVTRIRSFIVVDRLDHLRRGGRIGTAAALLGTALAMKPVLHVSEGRIVLAEKTRTTTKALGKLVDTVASVIGERKAEVAVHHMQCPDRADALASLIRGRLPQIERVHVSAFGAVLGAHVGPGAVGVVAFPDA